MFVEQRGEWKYLERAPTSSREEGGMNGLSTTLSFPIVLESTRLTWAREGMSRSERNDKGVLSSLMCWMFWNNLPIEVSVVSLGKSSHNAFELYSLRIISVDTSQYSLKRSALSPN